VSSFDLTKAARQDLKSIAKFTQERWGVRQRNTYLKEIDQVFRVLALTPELSRTAARHGVMVHVTI
jgi:toxin ParE1/3/4